ncbi:uncharacterized protein LOC128550439 [Mercenaria mercenaria]|uniref:uncharacterized protein LOC128550439 n=1 Tax=Mercenaria mercenaria TaxID=6596 RepID=UPI00234F7D4E|nr:uncharacterized protein LOC128550439 [Mercenaria mercenaria]
MGRKKEKGGNVTLVEKPGVINVEYQLVVAERDDLLEAELGYKRRIEQLEKENADTLQSFDVLYNENKILRSKLDTPDGVGADSVESYNVVYKDREHLREANRAFKRRIRQLEDDAAETQKSYNKLYQNHQLVTQKAQLETEFATKARDEKINEMEQEHVEISNKLKMFLKEREQYEYRIAEMDKERNELQNKYDFLAEEKHEFQLRCDVLQADREKLKETVMDLEEKVPDPEIKAKEEQQFLSLQAQVVVLQVSNTDASKEIHKLKEEIRVLNKLKREHVEMIDRASSVIVDEDEEENERQKTERYAEVEAELEENRQRGIYLLKENDRLKSETAVLESKVANLELNLRDLQEELKAKKTEVEDLSVLARDGQSLNEDFIALQDKVKDLSATRQALEIELIQEKKLSKLKIMELNKDLEKTKDKLNDTDKQKMKSEGDNNKLHDENETLQKVTEAQALELRNMKAQLEQIQNILEDKTVKYQDMKKNEKENQEELRESRLQLHIVRRELADLRKEKAGNFSTLKNEMQTAKDERQEETEQMRKETVRLREEVKKLKEYEHKITTMDSEIRRLMNRLRMTDRFRKLPKKSEKGEDEKDEVKELKKRQRELEKEKMVLIQEKRQWEILKEKYADLQMNNRRLIEENKRVRGDLDGSSFKVDTLEKRFKKLHVKVEDITNDPKRIQRATYVEKSDNRSSRLVAKKREPKPSENKELKKLALKTIDEESADKTTVAESFGMSAARGTKPTHPKYRRKFERKSTRTSEDMSRMRSKKPVLPKLEPETGLMYGKGYRELHKNRYRPASTLELL